MPGDPSFQGERARSLRVVEGALVVLSGVMGVEVGTSRVWRRAEELGIARVLFVNMLDRERADFFRALERLQEQLSERCVAVAPADRLRARADRHRRRPAHVRVHEPGRAAGRASPAGSRRRWPTSRQEYREKLLDEVVQTDEA